VQSNKRAKNVESDGEQSKRTGTIPGKINTNRILQFNHQKSKKALIKTTMRI